MQLALNNKFPLNIESIFLSFISLHKFLLFSFINFSKVESKEFMSEFTSFKIF
jgi:hypothetical protein